MFAETKNAVPETVGIEGGMRERVIEAIQTVYDPEIPVNIWEMGLIYKVDVASDGHVDVEMTLTTPNCPSAQELPLMVEEAALEVDGVKSVGVEIVWEPSWNPGMMSEVAKLELGMF